MDAVMLASFTDELHKIAAGNVMNVMKPAVGGMGSNIMAKPLPSPGIASGSAAVKPAPAKATNYTMVNSTAPMAASDSGAPAKMVSPPPVET